MRDSPTGSMFAQAMRFVTENVLDEAALQRQLTLDAIDHIVIGTTLMFPNSYKRLEALNIAQIKQVRYLDGRIFLKQGDEWQTPTFIRAKELYQAISGVSDIALPLNYAVQAMLVDYVTATEIQSEK